MVESKSKTTKQHRTLYNKHQLADRYSNVYLGFPISAGIIQHNTYKTANQFYTTSRCRKWKHSLSVCNTAILSLMRSLSFTPMSPLSQVEHKSEVQSRKKLQLSANIAKVTYRKTYDIVTILPAVVTDFLNYVL